MRRDVLIKNYGLEEHPEGGYYKETFRSNTVVHPKYANSERRAAATSIYFLLTSDNFSQFHKIKTEEIWHFYEGDVINIVVLTLDKDEQFNLIKLGSDESKGQVRQAIVEKNTWFASFVDDSGSAGYGFVGCSVSPGFEFEDFEIAKQEDLLKHYPKAEKYINKLCRQ